ncbi:hypothetical protein [Edaphobacter sp. 12200R-103]|uniref:hypothetical protein n=1 Tax=Edaphobacter sp. 12200R-103 TaxID=2703788 RepID=UPI00138D3837|nr:hypothetical protein [Edaphobacter sp. 12200R-103]QHS53553.1 hypothetical protein GWR55_18915 [Edaphobacter sp. 12200R-103]
MAGRSHQSTSDRSYSAPVFWHLLSLDAPTVATLWTWFIARAAHLQLHWFSLAAMTIAVWTLYAADRLLDALSPGNDRLEARHYFHREHRSAFMTGIAIASVSLALLLPHIPEAAIRLYLVLGGLVFGYFVIIHATRSAHRLPKEIAVGVCFAAATFIPTISRNPQLRLPLLLPALLLAAVCSLNCLFIYAWEHPVPGGQPPHPVTAIVLRYLAPLTLATFAVSGACVLLSSPPARLLYAAVSMAALALFALHQQRNRLSTLQLRAAADLALLTPLLLVPFL